MSKKRLRLFIRTSILLVIVVATGFTVYQVVWSKNTIKEGDTAPNFQLQNLDGQKIQLKDFRGEGVLLNFWGSWCDPCKREMPYINEAYQKKMKGVNIIAVNIRETPLVVNSFVDRYNLDFPILLDRSGTVTDAYSIGPIPTTFLIDKKGRIVKKIIGAMSDPEDVIKNLKLIQP